MALTHRGIPLGDSNMNGLFLPESALPILAAIFPVTLAANAKIFSLGRRMSSLQLEDSDVAVRVLSSWHHIGKVGSTRLLCGCIAALFGAAARPHDLGIGAFLLWKRMASGMASRRAQNQVFISR